MSEHAETDFTLDTGEKVFTERAIGISDESPQDFELIGMANSGVPALRGKPDDDRTGDILRVFRRKKKETSSTLKLGKTLVE